MTCGNADCHVILRGSQTATNYDAASVEDALQRLARAGLPRRVIIDASHGNSAKDHRRQPQVAKAIAGQRAAGCRGIVGMMLESFLVEGRQELVLGRAAELTRGQSVTDACLGWERTEPLFEELSKAVRSRRALKK